MAYIAVHVLTWSAHWPQVLYYVRSPKHLEALWFANVGNQVLWWTYVKACWRAVGSIIAKKGITFKTTMKVQPRRALGSASQPILPCQKAEQTTRLCQVA